MRIGLTTAALAAITLASLAQPGEALAGKGSGKKLGKVTLCHRGHEITVSANAVAAHLAHGDYPGECTDDGKIDVCRHGRRGDETARVLPRLAARLVSRGVADYGACGAEPACGDSDSDGADDCSDLCPGTSGEADADGCDCSQRGDCDPDGDGVPDRDDACPGTPEGDEADAEGCSCGQRGDCDSDGDGVPDRDDGCPGTPEGDDVYADGCTVVTLSAFAGPDVSALPGDVVEVVGQGSVLTGDPGGDLVYVWEQVGGDPVDFEFSSPPLTVHTEGSGPEATFRLTVSTADGSASASDEFTVTVDLDAVVVDYAKCDPATGHCYALALRADGSRDLRWWDDAKARANGMYFGGMRGHLATVTSPAERSFLSSVAGNAPAMLGGTDRAEEGAWVWADGPEDGSAIGYLPWAANEPSACVHWSYPEGDEDYLQHEGRGLNDINGARWYYVEFEPGW